MLRRIPRLILLCAILALLNGSLSHAQARSGPARPFPQHVAYAPGTLRPTNFTQVQQDMQVRKAYEDWKANYLVAAGRDSQGNPLYRVAFGRGSAATVSEGQGYGMTIVALMAGYDPQARSFFDGLWRFARAHPSGVDPRLMTWKVKDGVAVEGNDSAFDGDADIAYSLLLADAQWGSAGPINYRAEALMVIAGLAESTLGPQSKLPLLGDWVDPNGSPYSQYTPRSSDFMLSHFRTFARATQAPTWEAAATSAQAVVAVIQTHFSPATGLLPDFIVG